MGWNRREESFEVEISKIKWVTPGQKNPYRSKTRLYAEYIKLKYPTAKSASSAMTKLRSSAADTEAASTARMANATTRTIQKNRWKDTLSKLSGNVACFFLLTCAKQTEGIMDMGRIDE